MLMVYTEVRKINAGKYYYRTVSVREGNKVSKKRIYLGHNLSKLNLLNKERGADKKLPFPKKKSINMEIEIIKSKIASLLKKNKVIRAGIFGSYSKGKQKKGSDIDILIQIDRNHSKNISMLDIIKLENSLEKKLGRKIDLIEYSELHPLLKDKILNEEIRII